MNKKMLVRQAVIVWLTAAAAFAGADQPSQSQVQKHARKTTFVRRSCYVLLSNSPFPQPCDRVVGGLASTATPMDIIGEIPRHVVDTPVASPNSK